MGFVIADWFFRTGGLELAKLVMGSSGSPAGQPGWGGGERV